MTAQVLQLPAAGAPPVAAGSGHAPSPRVAALHARGHSGRLRARVTWPDPGERAPALLLFLADPAHDDDALCAQLSTGAGVVVLSVASRRDPADPPATAFEDAVAVLGWAADHAAELEADPGRIVVAGTGAGAALAAAVTLHARDEWWPAIARQVLIHPALEAWPASVPYASSLRSAPLGGASPATVVAGTGPRDGGRRFAARLREAGVAVEELHHAGSAAPALAAALARSLRRP